MADTTGGTAVQEAAVPQPQEGTRSQPPEGAAAEPQEGAAEDGKGTAGLDPAILVRERDEAKREAQGLRGRIAALEKAEQQRKDAALSDLEKAQQRITELESEKAESLVREQARTLRLATEAAARKLGFWDPDVAYGLVDRNAVEFDDDGNPRNVERLLADIAKAKPRLVSQPDFGGGPRGPSGEGPDMNAIIRRAAGRTS